MSIKAQRIGSSYVREISDILRAEVHDESIKNVSITYVKVSDDLSYAKVYFTTFDKTNVDELVRDLNKAAPFIRTCLAERIDVRHTPELEFVYDTSIDYGEKIERIIDKIKEKEEDA